jgi:hypothetical protein
MMDAVSTHLGTQQMGTNPGYMEQPDRPDGRLSAPLNNRSTLAILQLLADALRCMEPIVNSHGLEVDDSRMEGSSQLITAEVGTTRRRPVFVEPALIARCAVGSSAFYPEQAAPAYMPLQIIFNLCLYHEPVFLTMLGNVEAGAEGSLLGEITNRGSSRASASCERSTATASGTAPGSSDGSRTPGDTRQ